MPGISFRKRSRRVAARVEAVDVPKDLAPHGVYSGEEAGKTRLRAEAEASASALVREIEIDPREYPILLWSWKVENIIEKGDEKRKEGDDYAARVYANFRYDPEKASLWERTQYGIARALYGGSRRQSKSRAMDQ